MIGILHELEQRRLALRERSTMKRILIAQSCSAIAERGAVLDRVVAVARGITTWRLALGSVAVVAAIIGPRGMLRWAARAAAIYGLTRRLAAAVRNHPT